jgi:hypothetical protein
MLHCFGAIRLEIAIATKIAC